jgi:hypothetical protein
MDVKRAPRRAGTNFPSMNRSYCAFSFGSAVSGDGSNSQRLPKISSGAVGVRRRRAERAGAEGMTTKRRRDAEGGVAARSGAVAMAAAESG